MKTQVFTLVAMLMMSTQSEAVYLFTNVWKLLIKKQCVLIHKSVYYKKIKTCDTELLFSPKKNVIRYCLLFESCMYAIGPIFSKDWLNRPHCWNTEILENCIFASEVRDIDQESHKSAFLILNKITPSARSKHTKIIVEILIIGVYLCMSVSWIYIS